MDLSKIVSISGKPGLYVIKSQAIGRLIVESVIDGKCSPAFARDRMSSLEEISIFSTDEDRPLKDVFKMIHEKMGDYYILPSSIHEVLIVPATCGLDRDELKEMVCTVNRDQVAPEDQLSDEVYFYDGTFH